MGQHQVIILTLKKLLRRITRSCFSSDRVLSFTDLPVALQRLVVNYMDICSFLNFLRIPSTTVEILKPMRIKITSPEELDSMKLFYSSSINTNIVIVVIDRVDFWDFDRLIREVNVSGCRALVILKGKESIQSYASRLLGEVLTSNCALFFESDEVVPAISIKDGRIHCERIDLKGLYFEENEMTKVVFSNCTIDKRLLLFVPNCERMVKKELRKFSYTGVELEIQGCSQSFHDRLEVIEPTFCTSLTLKQDPAHRLVLRDELLEPGRLNIENVTSMESCTINAYSMELRWSCDSRFYETPWSPSTPLITKVSSATLTYLTIESNNDGVNPVVTEINAPNLNSVSLGNVLDDEFRSYDSGDVSTFLKNVPINDLYLYNTYQPLHMLDCLTTVVRLMIQIHEDIHDIVFSCQFPNLEELELRGTTRGLSQITSRVDAPHLTSLSVHFIAGDGTVASLQEAPKSLKRIVAMYPKLEELSVTTFPTYGVLQLPDITATVLLLSSRLKILNLCSVSVDFLRGKIPFLKLKTLFIYSEVDFEMNITVPKLESLYICCRGLNVVINSVLPALDNLTVYAKSFTTYETNVRSTTDYPKLKRKLSIHLEPAHTTDW